MIKKTGRSGKNKKFTHDQLLQALYHTLDTMERCMMPFVLLDNTAEQVVRGRELSLPEISIGVQRRHYTKYGKSTIRSLENDFEDIGSTLTFTHGGVPIVIWVINNHYKFFQYPDMVFYGAETFYIPNPFGRYWNARHTIK